MSMNMSEQKDENKWMSCKLCCFNNREETKLISRLKETGFDQHGALQDLRSIRGLSYDAYLTVDFTFEDILRWTKADIQRLQYIRTGSSSDCFKFWHREGSFCRLPLTQCPLDHSKDALFIDYEETLPGDVLPYSRCYQYLIGIIYCLIIITHISFLIIMHFQLYTHNLPFYKSLPTPTTPLPMDPNSIQISTPYDDKDIYSTIGYPSWVTQLSSLTFVDLKRYEIYVAIACSPIPIVFSIILCCCSSLLRRLLNTVLGGISEKIRRTVKMSSRQSSDISLHDYHKRVDYFFYLNPELKESGLRSIHSALHQAYNDIDDNDLRYEQHGSDIFIGQSRSTIRPILQQNVLTMWNCVFFGFYILPGLVSFFVNYGLILYIIRRVVYDRWEPESIPFHMLYTHPEAMIENEGTVCVLGVIGFNLMSLIWMMILLADHFSVFILRSSGVFERAAHVATNYANHLIKQIWDIVVIKNMLPYIEAHKVPDYTWGDLHHQLNELIQRFDLKQKQSPNQKDHGKKYLSSNPTSGIHHDPLHTMIPYYKQWDDDTENNGCSSPSNPTQNIYKQVEDNSYKYCCTPSLYQTPYELKTIELGKECNKQNGLIETEQDQSKNISQSLDSMITETPDGLQWDPFIHKSYQSNYMDSSKNFDKNKPNIVACQENHHHCCFHPSLISHLNEQHHKSASF